MRRMRTYNSIWKVPRMLYGIQNIALPFPVSYRQVGFFFGGVVLMWILNKFPPFSFINLWLVEYVGIPGFIAWFFTRQVLDGKAPHRFIMRWIAFKLSAHDFNRYMETPKSKKPYTYSSPVAYRKLSYTAAKEAEGGSSE
ncbi:conjugal transfer protein [Saccharibacillus sp. O23]|uniref:conjugal transfer protein n=1 Tax=Saccharibacillus sp. O23 TaxID=2009338 RepID=UPI000B4E4046|nr:conjugal transfer protein [Saccharibacillus sp. O23]OWR25669.1 conjugal transfer protein [Saccharibacillus sp. O23]